MYDLPLFAPYLCHMYGYIRLDRETIWCISPSLSLSVYSTPSALTGNVQDNFDLNRFRRGCFCTKVGPHRFGLAAFADNASVEWNECQQRCLEEGGSTGCTTAWYVPVPSVHKTLTGQERN